MSKNDDHRVLSRKRARDLTEQELEVVNGAFHTFHCTFDPLTRNTDGCDTGK
ncbi:MAG TPA: hypothetical protein VI685_17645 [Candidatus Angelobacter sp.]